ncbi:ATP-binding protein [Hominibacterium faecale]|uniref:ATP-binding protein n=1 Tax=Hominibacterium faecale TaxID=2839743 RepID=UPI001D12D36C|nr:ATP-binding protein [Hominibacterium faecale]MCC2865019.1 ATP-binding protein [Anaerovorax odorimutans]
MFFGRSEELESMNKRYNKNRFECVIIYGRRRVGKTSLIREFCKDKKDIYFSAIRGTAQDNLEELSKAIYMYKEPESPQAPIYASFADAFDEITNIVKKEQVVFVIDEYPYLAEADGSVSSRLQHIIDHVWQDSNLYLILCGSSMSFMENQVLGYESPLYGRRTAQYKIQAMNYREITVFNPELDAGDQALVYGITGGIPHYINKLDVVNDVDEAIIENIFDSSAYLFEEPENLLKQELREPAVYNSIISAIAGGASRVNEIATKVGLATGACSKYLKVLLDLEIVRKETPITEKPGKKTIYVIEDNFFRFWYRFVSKNLSSVNAGRIKLIYDAAIRKNYPDYMGLVFEKMCKEYLLYYENNPDYVIKEIGQWWGTDKKNRKEIQIDIVGTVAEGKEYIIGSCKYKNEKINIDELQLLQDYAEVFGLGNKYHFYMFSKGGFTDALIEKADAGEVKLISLEDMYL